jgi:hypothetical protein
MPATTAPALDPACVDAVDLARAAAESDAPGLVGDHLGVSADADRVVTHLFATLDPAYRGWTWAVTVARASRGRAVTVDDVVLLPGSEAVLAPEWVPWSERLQPGDVGVGDLLPTAADDPRLVPAYAGDDLDEAEQAVGWELGLGRERVLSYEGRDDAAQRWYDGEAGPDAAIAKAAPDHCATCGFYTPLAGGLRQLFGACANVYAPDDGRVVSADHGCGAHSQAVVVPAARSAGDDALDAEASAGDAASLADAVNPVADALSDVEVPDVDALPDAEAVVDDSPEVAADVEAPDDEAREAESAAEPDPTP